MSAQAIQLTTKYRHPDYQMDTTIMGLSTTVDIFCAKPDRDGRQEVEHIKIFGERFYTPELMEVAQAYADENA